MCMHSAAVGLAATMAPSLVMLPGYLGFLGVAGGLGRGRATGSPDTWVPWEWDGGLRVGACTPGLSGREWGLGDESRSRWEPGCLSFVAGTWGGASYLGSLGCRRGWLGVGLGWEPERLGSLAEERGLMVRAG